MDRSTPSPSAVRALGANNQFRPALSVVVPVHDERDNILPLLDEIVTALRPLGRFEIVCIDDASLDGTAEVLAAAQRRIPELVVGRHERNRGQSAAVLNGVLLATGAWVATLDGDGQNDPADLPRLLAARDRLPEDVKLLAGWRTARRDSWSKRLGSRLANAVRAWLLRDGTPDTGCGIKLFEREAFLALPRFDHMHRYLPALFQRDGWRAVSVPVNHRARAAGRSKYTNLQRLWVGVFDLAAVAWLMRRPVRAHAIRIPRTIAGETGGAERGADRGAA